MATPFESSIDDVSVAVQQRTGELSTCAKLFNMKIYASIGIYDTRD